jgi:hypothetical protein
MVRASKGQQEHGADGGVTSGRLSLADRITLDPISYDLPVRETVTVSASG